MVKEHYPKNPLAQRAHETIWSSNFGSDFDLVPIVDFGLATHVNNALKHLDHNAKLRPEPGYATVYEGLAFDPDRVRSQAFAIYRKRDERPVAVSAMVILPASWIQSQRFFEKADRAIIIRNFASVTRGENPDFLIMPGWTYVDKEFLLRFALSGVRAMLRLVDLIQSEAPKHTWMMEIPRGVWPRERWIETEAIAREPVGTCFPSERLPFSLDILGINDLGANASVKMSHRWGLERVKNVASIKTLGPIFAKFVR